VLSGDAFSSNLPFDLRSPPQLKSPEKVYQAPPPGPTAPPHKQPAHFQSGWTLNKALFPLSSQKTISVPPPLAAARGLSARFASGPLRLLFTPNTKKKPTPPPQNKTNPPNSRPKAYPEPLPLLPRSFSPEPPQGEYLFIGRSASRLLLAFPIAMFFFFHENGFNPSPSAAIRAALRDSGSCFSPKFRIQAPPIPAPTFPWGDPPPLLATNFLRKFLPSSTSPDRRRDPDPAQMSDYFSWHGECGPKCSDHPRWELLFPLQPHNIGTRAPRDPVFFKVGFHSLHAPPLFSNPFPPFFPLPNSAADVGSPSRGIRGRMVRFFFDPGVWKGAEYPPPPPPFFIEPQNGWLEKFYEKSSHIPLFHTPFSPLRMTLQMSFYSQLPLMQGWSY